MDLLLRQKRIIFIVLSILSVQSIFLIRHGHHAQTGESPPISSSLLELYAQETPPTPPPQSPTPPQSSQPPPTDSPGSSPTSSEPPTPSAPIPSGESAPVKEIESRTQTSTSSQESVKNPPSYVFEIEVGINAFGYNINQTIDRYNLAKLSDTTALAYNMKTGVVFLDHWKSLLIFGYSKRPNFEYPVNYIEPNQSLLESHRYYRFGFEQQYLIWAYQSKFNLAVGLENSWLRRSVIVTERTNVGLPGTSISRPRSLKWDEYLLSPKIKFLYRLSPNSALHFSFSYHVLFPSIEYYPQFLFGIDLSFFLRKPKKPKERTLEDRISETLSDNIPKIPIDP